MKKYLRYLAPGLYGLLIYFSIRVITDTATNNPFWNRSWALNFFEMLCAFSASYLYFYIYKQVVKRYFTPLPRKVSALYILKELGILTLVNILAVNSTITFMASISHDGLSLHDFAIINIVPGLYNLLIAMLDRGRTYLEAFVQNQLLVEKLENDKLNTELHFLKEQFHPHFLFNALNTVYFQMDESTIDAKLTLEKLSDLLRYQLYEDQQHLSEVSREIAFLEKYISLQKQRISPETCLKLTYDEFGEEKIYPLLLIPFVENAFKYVDGDQAFIHIQLKRVGEELHFQVTNSRRDIHIPTKKAGIGLVNLRRRLDLLHPDEYQLDIQEERRQFTATLKLPLS
ncbi:MAG: sensor histidine kinase [Bacteroidota bacterium]